MEWEKGQRLKNQEEHTVEKKAIHIQSLRDSGKGLDQWRRENKEKKRIKPSEEYFHLLKNLVWSLFTTLSLVYEA